MKLAFTAMLALSFCSCSTAVVGVPSFLSHLSTGLAQLPGIRPPGVPPVPSLIATNHSLGLGVPFMGLLGNLLGFPHVPTGNLPEVAKLPTENIPGLPTGNLPGFPTGNLPGVPTGKLPGVTTGNLPGKPTGNLPGLPTGNLPGVPTGNLPGLPTGNLPGVPTGNLPVVPPVGKKARKPKPTAEKLAGHQQCLEKYLHHCATGNVVFCYFLLVCTKMY